MNLWDVLPQISMSGLYLKEGGFICTNNFMLVLKILDTHKTEMNISISVCNVCCCTIIALPHALQQCWLRFFNIHITLMESIRSNWKCHWPLSQIASYSGVTLLYAVHWFVCDSIKSAWLSEGWVWLCSLCFICIAASDRLGGWIMAEKVPNYCCWIDHNLQLRLLILLQVIIAFIMLNLECMDSDSSICTGYWIFGI